MYKLFGVGGGIALGAILALGGCVVEPIGGYYAGGYAPYGESYVTPDGYTVVYDAGPGAYAVVGVPGVYWWDGYYYRRHGGHWERSHDYRGHWAYRRAERVPFLARRGGQGHPPGSAWAHTKGPPPGRYGNAAWGANQARNAQRNNQITAYQHQRNPQQAWRNAQAQQQYRNLPGRYPPGFVPQNAARGQAQHVSRQRRPYCPPGKKCEPKK